MGDENFSFSLCKESEKVLKPFLTVSDRDRTILLAWDAFY
jgi:hypothetical protein